MPKRRRDKTLVEAAKAVAEVSRECGVLIIEADPNVQWKLARMLAVQGNRVVGTTSGDGALALIAQWPVDIVLVDEDLPGMDGFEVARRIREIHPEIPVVLMTAAESPDLHVAARLAGAVACLTKPFRREVLAELIASLRPGGALPAPAE
jgi:DNA-binding response OmpR family regulator